MEITKQDRKKWPRLANDVTLFKDANLDLNYVSLESVRDRFNDLISSYGKDALLERDENHWGTTDRIYTYKEETDDEWDKRILKNKKVALDHIESIKKEAIKLGLIKKE